MYPPVKLDWEANQNFPDDFRERITLQQLRSDNIFVNWDSLDMVSYSRSCWSRADTLHLRIRQSFPQIIEYRAKRSFVAQIALPEVSVKGDPD
jgi:hypothetical protein